MDGGVATAFPIFVMNAELIIGIIIGFNIGWVVNYLTFGRMQRRRFRELLELNKQILHHAADGIIIKARKNLNRLEDN